MSERLDLHRDIVRLARIDFRTFVYRAALILLGEMLLPNWHIDVLIRAAEKVAEGSTRRLLACLPPRYLKTFIFSVCLPAWLLGRDPRSKIICASYSMPLAERFNLDVIRLMTSDWYRQVFPKTRLNKRRTNVTELTTTAGGFRLAASVGGTLTGRGADLLIIDDPIKADEAHSETARENCKTWFARSVSTRLNKPKSGAFVVVAQRLHAADLPGQLIEQGGWEQVIIPAIMPERRVFDVLKGGLKGYKDAGDILQPERQDEEMLQQQKLTMGERDFEAQFNQCPLPPTGAVFKTSWISRYETAPTSGMIQAVIQSWDTAYEMNEDNDYNVCSTWAVCGDGYYLLDVFRERLPFFALEKKVYALKKQWNARMVIIEKKGSGISLLQNIRILEGHRWVHSLEPDGGKIERAEQQSPKVEKGLVHLPKDAPWLTIFENELFSFPGCKHDDQVDSMVQFLRALDFHATRNIIRGLV